MVVPVGFVMSLSVFAVMPSSQKSACDVISCTGRYCDVINDVTFRKCGRWLEVW